MPSQHWEYFYAVNLYVNMAIGRNVSSFQLVILLSVIIAFSMNLTVQV